MIMEPNKQQITQQQQQQQSNNNLTDLNGQNSEYIEKLTKPKSVLSYEESTFEDEKISIQIENNIKDKFDTQETRELKDKAFVRLQEIVNKWSQEIALNEKKIVEQEAHKYKARLLPFGSYYLGVSSKNGDIDLICVAPHYIQRDTHFFDQLAALIQNERCVTNLNKRRDAKNPIINFEYDQISIDISIAILDSETVPDNIEQYLPDEILQNIDEKSVQSLNGRRNNQMILESVGSQKETFRLAAKCIKLWSKSKGIVDNMKGYFGGISWAIMVAKICQLFPKYKVNKILEKFFAIYNEWQWEQIPIKVEESKEDPKLNQLNDAQQSKLRQQVPEVIILTPAYPCYNSTTRVNKITHQVIKEMIQRTHNKIQNEILPGKCFWSAIFENYAFFDNFNHFIQIDIVSNDTKDQFQEWLRYVEFKLIKLYTFLINISVANNLKVHPYPEPIDCLDSEYQNATSYFIGLKKMQSTQQMKKKQKCIEVFTSIQAFIKHLHDKMNISQLNNLRIYQIAKQNITHLKVQQKKYSINERQSLSDLEPPILKKVETSIDKDNDFDIIDMIK